MDNNISYDKVCNCVGRFFLEKTFEIERITQQASHLAEELKKKVLEKDKRIKELEEELKVLRGRISE